MATAVGGDGVLYALLLGLVPGAAEVAALP
jgi:hypothetical protein